MSATSGTYCLPDFRDLSAQGATRPAARIATPGAMSLPVAVERLSSVAINMLALDRGPHTVLAFLGSQGTAHLYGSDAAAVVARVIRGAA